QPSSYFIATALISSRLASRFSEAKSWLAKVNAHDLENPELQQERLMLAFATGNRGEVERILEGGGNQRKTLSLFHAILEIQQGRFRSAERLRLQASGHGTTTTAIADEWVIRSALENAEVGRSAQARREEGKV